MTGPGPSLETIMERLFGDPSWHRIVSKPGVWAYSRCSGGWNGIEQDKPEENVTTDFLMHRAVADSQEEKVTEVNVAVGEEQATKVELATLADKVRYYDQLTEAINQAQADRLKVQDEIKALMGTATVATLHGVPTFTFANKATWRTTDIKKAMPHLVAQYMVKQQVEVIDWDRFLAHHGDAVKEYQVREFRRVSGTRATRG